MNRSHFDLATGETTLIPVVPVRLADGKYTVVDEGDVPAGATILTRDEYRAAIYPIEQMRADAWERIKVERDRRTQQGGYQVAGKWFHSDTFSRTQQLGLVMLGANLPAGTQWKTMDGSFVAMTPQLAAQVFAAAAASDIAIFAAAEQHRAAMIAYQNPLAYEFNTGWPPAFGE